MNTRTLLSRCAGLLVAALAAGCTGSGAGAHAAAGFDSADHAVEALIAALRSDDQPKLHEILGEGADEILDSGDPVADQNTRTDFLALYDEAHKLVPAEEGGMTLIVGNSEWPMPIPVVSAGGRWSFDAEAGKDEVLSRRIGRNELDVVQVCLAIVDAEREYAAMDPDGDGVPEYAMKFMSDPGKKNGLYWPNQEGEPESPLGALVADAEEHGYTSAKTPEGAPRPFHGYYFRILTGQWSGAEGGQLDYVVNGKMLLGFAVIACPAEYANSGLKTFQVNYSGVVWQRDLGEKTLELARAVTKFDPSGGWEKVPADKQ
jgi:hypothetical protein